ncbi:MAG: Crp/Fnr family transcriptional regulator [Myxococcales bacterium]|nr:Crp/Fnr family transcriptional regulator [Myxococcales bacterium]
MSTMTSARFPFLARLGEASQRELANLPISRASAGQHLLSRGDDAAGAYFVTSGALRVYYLTKDGREATLYRVEPGGTCILALTSTFNREPYPAWVDAGPQGAGFARLPAPAFRKMFDAEPEFRGFLFGVLSGRVFELMRTLEEAGTAQMEERVARYLTRNADGAGWSAPARPAGRRGALAPRARWCSAPCAPDPRAAWCAPGACESRCSPLPPASRRASWRRDRPHLLFHQVIVTPPSADRGPRPSVPRPPCVTQPPCQARPPYRAQPPCLT